MVTFHIITLFPSTFESYLGASIIGRAIERKKISVKFYNPRDFTKDKWKRVDRRPYGGGPGMVLEAESVLRAATKALGRKKRSDCAVILFDARGAQFDTPCADKLATRYKHVVLICGRYEGIDARVRTILRATPLSVGPYTLTGGELPALTVIDAVTRRLPGVLGDEVSVEERRIAGKDVYTRPEVLVWKGRKYRVPRVLLSGHHKKIDAWRKPDSSLDGKSV